MDIKVPKWASTIEDEGMLTFAAFVDRMCRINGYGVMYTIHIDDLVRICNKRAQTVLNWLRKSPEISDNIQIGRLYDTVICFTLQEPIRLYTNPLAGRSRKECLYPKELKSDRQKYIWMYLLGCLNYNLITGEDPKYTSERNSFGIKEFHITREAAGYIKKKDR